VNWWLAGASVLVAGIGPCLWVCLREQAASALVAVAEFVGGIVFARSVERRLWR